MTGAPPETGGVDLGPMGNVAGTIPGMSATFKIASRTPEWQAILNQTRPSKDYNDQPAGWLAGSSDGSALYGPAPGGWSPTF
jgi:hypothetical protein